MESIPEFRDEHNYSQSSINDYRNSPERTSPARNALHARLKIHDNWSNHSMALSFSDRIFRKEDNPLHGTTYTALEKTEAKIFISWRQLLTPLVVFIGLLATIAMYQYRAWIEKRDTGNDLLLKMCTSIYSTTSSQIQISNLTTSVYSAYTPQSHSTLEGSIYDFYVVSQYLDTYVNKNRIALFCPYGVIRAIYPVNSTLDNLIGYNILSYLNNSNIPRTFASSHMSNDFFTQISMSPLYAMNSSPALSNFAIPSSFNNFQLTNANGDFIACDLSCNDTMHQFLNKTICKMTECLNMSNILDDVNQCCIRHVQLLWGFIAIAIPLTQKVKNIILAAVNSEGYAWSLYARNETRGYEHIDSSNGLNIDTSNGNKWFNCSDGDLWIVSMKKQYAFGIDYIPFVVIQSLCIVVIPLLIIFFIRAQNKFHRLVAEFIPQRLISKVLKGEKINEKFNGVSILFSDIVGYTKLSASLDPELMMELLDELFRGYDNLIQKHGVYKTDIIGDSFMCMTGCPHAEHPVASARRILHFAFDIIDVTKQVSDAFGIVVQIRIGVHSGDVNGCVMGSRVPHYYPFGDAVNLASRMESHGAHSRVHISHETACLVSGLREFEIERRPMMEIKSKGLLQTFFVNKLNQ
jgi:class 3 adenylate cyclase